MYIFQKNYNIEYAVSKEKQECCLVIILPSEPEKYLKRFVQLIKECVTELNEKRKWNIVILNNCDNNRSPDKNYISIYNADVVVAECSDKKPNVFYMMGLAHACGRPVCACYKAEDGKSIEIPFNLHGRQSMTYSVSKIELQKEFKKDFKEWLNNYE